MSRTYQNSNLGQNTNGSFYEGIPAGSVYNATLPSYTDGDTSVLHTDKSGQLLIAEPPFDTGALITASGATTTQTLADQTNLTYRGVIVVLDMTVVGTGSVTLAIQGKDSASGKYFTLLTGAAVTTNSTNVYTVYPGATATANVSASTVLPRTWRIVVTANNANATTYTVGANLIP